MSFVLFGGSFNPFHNGHLKMVEAAHAAYPRSQIVLIPAGSPPHKQGQEQISFEHRFTMLKELAEQLGSWIECSDIEGQQKAPTYTLDTIRRFRQQREPCSLYFLIGGDSLKDLHKWHQFKNLISEVQILTIERPGIGTDSAFESLAKHVDRSTLEKLRQHVIAMPLCSLSSSQLRLDHANGQRIDSEVPATIYNYLRDHQLI
jgi:nicotinate-nucleotide adenylyltransferase